MRSSKDGRVIRAKGQTLDTWKGSGGGAWTVKTIKQIVEDGQASASTRIMYKFFDVFSPVISPLATPKRTRVEHWPMNRVEP